MFLIKIPTSQGGMDKTGSESAPDMVADAVHGFYSSEKGFKHNFIIDEVKIASGNLEETNDNIFSKADELMGNKCVFVGGDHSVTYPLFKAFAKRHSNPGMVIFDAHPDCVSTFHPPSHEDWLRTLVDDGVVKPENIILVAVRNIDETERKFLAAKKIRVYEAARLRGNVDEACDGIMELANAFGALYVSVDIDAVDPAHAPGTGYIEPAGLSARDMVYFIQRLRLLKNFRAADIVEVNPGRDVNNMTVKLAAKLAVEMW